MWQAALWLWLSESGDIHVLDLFKGLNETRLCLQFFFLFASLRTGILQASEYDSRKLSFSRVVCDSLSGSRQHNALQVILGLCQTDVFCSTEVGTDSH